jgi:ABC-type lipoprotein export system ATPase subunit
MTDLDPGSPTPTGRPPLLRGDRLEKTYPDGDVRALRGVSVDVAEGEFAAITGPSGCGKSTLLHLLGGLDRPTSGSIRFRGTPLSEVDLDAYRARQVGFVFQSFHLIPTLTALENVQVPMFAAGRPRADRPGVALDLLEVVGLSHRTGHLPKRLSIGERQRVAIARALANEPALLLADEPTGNLDSRSQGEILDLLARLRAERSITLLIVTHSAEVAAAADREIRIKDGQLVNP